MRFRRSFDGCSRRCRNDAPNPPLVVRQDALAHVDAVPRPLHVRCVLRAVGVLEVSRPTVCCVMLVNGREAMVKRAIASFRAQTYERKRLLIVYSGDVYPCPWIGNCDGLMSVDPRAFRTIGASAQFRQRCWQWLPIGAMAS